MHGCRRSAIKNPLSAIIESPGSSLSRIPDCTVSCRSETKPLYKFDIKLIAPEGVIPIKALNVL